MGTFERIEKSVENAVDNLFSRAFRSSLKPVELATGIKKAMDERATVMSSSRTIAPNIFQISLSVHDYEKINEWGEYELSTELAAIAKDHAQDQRYTFLGPISIEFLENETLPKGKITVKGTSRRGAVAPAVIAQASAQNPILDINGERYLLTGTITVIGRGSACDITLDDNGISRRHLELKITPNGVIATDLNTTNGTFVEGHRISAATLVDGNTITIGHTKIMFWSTPE